MIDLRARMSQTRDANDGATADMQLAVRGQTQQIDTARRDVLTQLARAHRKALLRQFLKQFFVHQVHLPQVGLRGVFCNPRTMLDRHTTVRIAFDTEPHEQADPQDRRLAESVLRACADRDNVAARMGGGL